MKTISPAKTQAQAKLTEGLALHQQGAFAQAAALYRQVLEIQADNFDALHLLGVIAAQSQSFAQAVALFDQAHALNPHNADLYSNRGAALRELQQYDRALADYDQAIKLKPDFAAAYFNRGIAYKALNDYAAARQNYDRAIALKPDYAEAYNNRGVVLKELNQLDAALRDYDRAIALKPDYADAYNNRGIVLKDQRQCAAALQSYQKALQLQPDFIDAQINVGLCYLLMGDYAHGWQAYEWRWHKQTAARQFSQPRWLGQVAPQGKTILLHSEQGLGDTLQFCRYAPKLAALGAKLVLEVQKPLLTLLTKLDGITEIIAQGDDLPDFDYHCPLLSLPLAFKTDLDTIPAPSAYLHSDASKLAQWQTRLGNKTKPRIGLAWSGNAAQKNDINRSIPLSVFMKILCEDFQFVSLQKEVRPADKALLQSLGEILHFGDELQDFSDTAALVDLVDLVISVDSSVAHLAGALGKPLWVLLTFNADWRWLLDRSDSPWYPSAKLYRRAQHEAWEAVLDRVNVDLAEHFANGSAPAKRRAMLDRTREAQRNFSQGLALYMDGKLDQANALCQQSLQFAPQHFDTLSLLAVIAIQKKHYPQALTLLDQAIAANPNAAEIHNNRGLALRSLKHYDAARQSFETALALAPDYATTHLNYANLLSDIKQYPAALQSCAKALALQPDYAEAYYSRGNVLNELQQYTAALQSYDQAIALKPDYADAYNNRGNTLREVQRYEAALQSYAEAIALNPDYPDAHYNSGYCHLQLGRFAQGWEQYEWRWKTWGEGRSFAQPLWLGQVPLTGKTILLHSEQGLGDTLQFCRYAQKVAALGAARVILEVPKPLLALLTNLDGTTEVIARGSELPRFDYHCPLLSLPLAFKTDLGNIPAPAAYLRSDAHKTAYWQTRLGTKSKPRIGIVWSGNANHINDHRRSIPLPVFMKILCEDFHFVSLQKEVSASDIALLQTQPEILHVGDELQDFSDTAALVDLIDLVISVDTSVVHLAGAMGKPVWILLPFNPDWRWLLDRNDSPWYPSARLYRQALHESWESVLDRVQADLTVHFKTATAQPAINRQNRTLIDQAAEAQLKFAEGCYLHQQGELAQAQALYQQVLQIQPQHFDALHMLGMIAAQNRNFVQALQWFEQAIAIKSDDAKAHCNRGFALWELQQGDAALHSYDKAIALQPDLATAYNNRGIVLRALKQHEAALQNYDQAIALKPDYAEAYYNRGNVLKDAGERNAALQSYHQAIALNPDYAEAHFNLGLLQLQMGDWLNGWREYEWRWKKWGIKRDFPQPLWQGHAPLSGKTILLHSEQGFGDTIQFCRYASKVFALGAKVILEVQQPLVTLLTNLDGVSDVIAQGSALPDFDYHCPLLSLPLAFKTDLDNIPAPTAYLASNAAKLAQWQTRLGAKTKPRIGLAWSGSNAHQNDHNRSIPLSTFMKILSEDFQFVSLQKEVRQADKALLQSLGEILQFGDELQDFSDTAALVELVDRVISVDTSVAHLAGAMGKPVWILLPFNADWRWLLDRSDSPWYQNARLYRQAADETWDSLLEKVKSALMD